LLPQSTANLSFTGEAAGAHLFGGNVLAPRGDMTGPGSYAEAVQDLNVTGLRYPGGSLTETLFDISNPDASTATHADTGEVTEFIPISGFMSYAEENGQAVTIVIPTRFELSDEVDEQGNRMPEIDEEALRDFIHEVASGTYGDAEIRGFEIGNEYWGSGQMNAVEYGRLAAEMATIIDDELRLVSEIHEIDTSEMSVLAQMGHNYNHSCLSEEYEDCSPEEVLADLAERYPEMEISDDLTYGSGNINWTAVNNELIRMSFDTEQEIESLDGVIAHVYTRGTDFSRYNDLDMIDRIWLSEEEFEELEIHVTEWNLKSGTDLDRHEDYGLFQAHDMLNTVEEFMAAGVDQAHVWPLIQNTSNPLCTGFEYSESSAPGKMFSMMSENLPGKTMLDFTPGGDRQTEIRGETLDLHAFASPDEMVLYLASTSDQSEVTDVDLSGLVAGFSEMEISVLGVCEGEQSGSSYADSHINECNAEDIFRDGTLEVDLAPGEIMQVVIRDLVPTESFGEVLATLMPVDDVLPEGIGETELPMDEDILSPSESSDDSILGIPTVPVVEEEEEFQPDEPDEDSGGDEWGGIAFALALLPLLALFGMS